jgi:hypothetical protein
VRRPVQGFAIGRGQHRRQPLTQLQCNMTAAAAAAVALASKLPEIWQTRGGSVSTIAHHDVSCRSQSSRCWNHTEF